MDFVFLRGEALVGIFLKKKHHYPFDLQVGPLEHRGELAPSRQILESTLSTLLLSHCTPSASLVMPNSDPWDELFCPTLTLMIDSYILMFLLCNRE